MTTFGVSLTLALVFAALAVSARFIRTLHGLGFTFAVLAVGSGAMAYPPVFIAWGGFELKHAISPLVQLILLGMGMTLTVDDFRRVAKMPRAIVIGFVLQFTVMPLAGFLFASLFGLTGAVATGLILIGSVPGGTSSNVITLLARGNVPLSVTMTACSTLLSPVMTPLAMKLLAGTYVPIDGWAMMQSILTMVIAPLVVGLIIKRYLPQLATRCARGLPVVAMFGICMVIGITVAASREQLLTMGVALFGAAACHNATGYLLGYWVARAAGLNRTDARTVALEVGIQNGGMATGLAFGVLKSSAAALGSAVFGPWSAITSSVLASWWARRTERDQ
ncbi:MAG: bile acid:sodium symporter family protein [Verrucomicrobia bacterium]|nr:bile acid:sodium symporter family protein [Verrucomicrobiota bacterium]